MKADAPEQLESRAQARPAQADGESGVRQRADRTDCVRPGEDAATGLARLVAMWAMNSTKISAPMAAPMVRVTGTSGGTLRWNGPVHGKEDTRATARVKRLRLKGLTWTARRTDELWV